MPTCHWCGAAAHPGSDCPAGGAPPTPVPASVPAATRSLISGYLLWHAVSTCQGRCGLCTEAIRWLRAHGGVPIGIEILQERGADPVATA